MKGAHVNTNCEHKHIDQIGDATHCRACEPVTYYSTADTAKLIRKALKAAFPETVFSVRSKVYSGGSSITVGYTDGPPTHAVEDVVKPFAGADFDGMQDLKTYHNSILDGRPVHFGANFVFVSRKFTNMDNVMATIENFFTENVKDYNRHTMGPFSPWAVLSSWDARWETITRASNRVLLENSYGWQIA